MAELDIKSQTIDKALDKLVEPVYIDAAKPLITTTKGALGFCSQFIVSGVKPYMYSKIKECEYKIKEIDKKLEEKYNNIPDKNKTEPRTNILGPAVDVLKYNLEEEHIKEMFINLIGNDLDISKQPKVLPSYIEIVKQLSKSDAELLTYFSKNNMISEPILKLKVAYSTGGFTYYSNDLILINNNTYKILKSITLDNLCRLKIIELDFMEHRNDNSIYETAFKSITSDKEFEAFSSQADKKLDYSKGLLKITDFGKNFIDICLS